MTDYSKFAATAAPAKLKRDLFYEERKDNMGFFDELAGMDPNAVGGFNTSPFAAGAYIGYMDKCERINAIADRICNGETSFDVDDDITEADLAEVKKIVEKRMGCSVCL